MQTTDVPEILESAKRVEKILENIVYIYKSKFEEACCTGINDKVQITIEEQNLFTHLYNITRVYYFVINRNNSVDLNKLENEIENLQSTNNYICAFEYDNCEFKNDNLELKKRLFGFAILLKNIISYLNGQLDIIKHGDTGDSSLNNIINTVVSVFDRIQELKKLTSADVKNLNDQLVSVIEKVKKFFSYYFLLSI